MFTSFDPITVALTLAQSALNSVAHFSRVEYPTFQDQGAVLLPATAAHIDPSTSCVVYTDPATNSVLRVELPHPSTPDYDYCYASLTGTQFNG